MYSILIIFIINDILIIVNCEVCIKWDKWLNLMRRLQFHQIYTTTLNVHFSPCSILVALIKYIFIQSENLLFKVYKVRELFSLISLYPLDINIGIHSILHNLNNGNTIPFLYIYPSEWRNSCRSRRPPPPTAWCWAHARDPSPPECPPAAATTWPSPWSPSPSLWTSCVPPTVVQSLHLYFRPEIDLVRSHSNKSNREIKFCLAKTQLIGTTK